MAEVAREHGEGLADILDTMGIEYDMEDGIVKIHFTFSVYEDFLSYKEAFDLDPEVIVSMSVVETKSDKKGNISEKLVSQTLPRISKKKTGWYLVGDKSINLPYYIKYPSKKTDTMTKEELFEEEKHKEIESLKIYWIEKKIGLTQQLPPRERADSDLELGGTRKKGTRRRKNKSKNFSMKRWL
jgi:hypothetical protein